MAIRLDISRTMAVWLLLTGSAYAQLRTIDVGNQHRNDAVVITRVTYGAVDLQCGMVQGPPGGPVIVQPIVPFQAAGDWISQITVYLLNRTGKTIVSTGIDVSFPETGDGRTPQTPMRSVPIRLGPIPASVAYTRSGQPLKQDPALTPLTFAPGQTIAISLGNYQKMFDAQLASLLPVASASKAQLREVDAYFDDGMKWSATRFWNPDPQKPGDWTPADPRFFPGRPSWPPVSAK